MTTDLTLTLERPAASSRLIETEGTVELDTAHARVVSLDAQLTVRRVLCQPGDWIQRGAIVAEVSSNTLQYHQELYLWAEEQKWRRMHDDLSLEITNAHIKLRHLGFTDACLDRLRRRKQPFDPWPVRSDAEGTVIAVAEPGQQLEWGMPLCSVAWRRVIYCTVDNCDAPSLGALAKFGKAGKVCQARVGDIALLNGQARVRLDITDPEAAGLLGETVLVKFRTRKPLPVPVLHLPLSGPLPLNSWVYQLPPRGAKLREILAASNRAEDLTLLRLDRPEEDPANPPVHLPAPTRPPAIQSDRTTLYVDDRLRARHGLTSATVGSRDFNPPVTAETAVGPTPSPTVLAIPEDCIAQVGKTCEVLVDDAYKLTPHPVKIGQSLDGFIEVTSGLVEGQQVIRQLEDLAANHKRIRALLLGLWDNNGLGWWQNGLDC